MKNLGETEVGMATGFNHEFIEDPSPTQVPEECVVVISGPDADQEIYLLAMNETYLPPATAMKLYQELGRRLEEMGFIIP